MSNQTGSISRREFLGRGTKLAAGAAIAPALQGTREAGSTRAGKRRVAIVGTGSRGTRTWGINLLQQFPETVEMAGLCDVNSQRVEVAKEMMGVDAPTYVAGDFERMIGETQPEMVIITTPDCFHVDYAVRAMKLGCDVLSEKPLATEATQCQRLLETEKRTGRNVYVGFNARYFPSSEHVKKILDSGELGRVHSVDFAEYLDVQHGASYFRRWHGIAQYSGTLLVHKACHHFDKINWWLGADPIEVNAFGEVAFYGSNNPFRGEKCRGCRHQDRCDFYWDITEAPEWYTKLYVQCEDEDGYIRDDCVWDRDIDTYDKMTVEVSYENGVLLSYTLNAFMPYEGQRFAFNGEKGRLDVRDYNRQAWDVPYETEFRLSKNFGESRAWRLGGEGGVDLGTGGHGGADPKLKEMIFNPTTPDPLGQRAGSRAGVMSSLIGIAARRSIEMGERVRIGDLIPFPHRWNW